jgi:hypothetical protein
MPRAGSEPAIPMFEQSKTVRALEHAAIGTGGLCYKERNTFTQTERSGEIIEIRFEICFARNDRYWHTES